MLTSLRIKNLALVEESRVQFGPGLNIITGETGAGKSILMGALGLLLGERADKSLIRSGADHCSAEAMFELAEAGPIRQVLEDLGLDSLEEPTLIIRRQIRANGSGSHAWINDQPVTLHALKQVGDCLVDMHGPYDHQSLLHADAQRDILDAFGQHAKPRAEYQARYTEWRELERRRQALMGDDSEVAAQIELLTYKVNELQDADLSEAEEEEVRQEHAVFGHAQRIMELANGVAMRLTEEDGAVVDLLAGALKALRELSPLLPEAEAWHDELDAASTRIREVATELAERVEGIDADPARLAWLDERITVYQKMKRKYGPTVTDALQQLDQARQRLQDLQGRDQQLAELAGEQAQVRQALLAAGKTLHRQRCQAAGKLAKAITAELRLLGFASGQFEVQVNSGDPEPTGLDAVEFLFEPNPGEGMRPLRQIASSGEISRVMLAIKAVLARHDQIPVLVFDEIDANIGGEMGAAVGRKLAAVAAHHQVCCITHLPQVAMYGTTHFAVRKAVVGQRTRTDVVPLTGDERIEEMARMLGGKELTEHTLTHARELLAKVGG